MSFPATAAPTFIAPASAMIAPVEPAPESDLMIAPVEPAPESGLMIAPVEPSPESGLTIAPVEPSPESGLMIAPVEPSPESGLTIAPVEPAPTPIMRDPFEGIFVWRVPVAFTFDRYPALSPDATLCGNDMFVFTRAPIAELRMLSVYECFWKGDGNARNTFLRMLTLFFFSFQMAVSKCIHDNSNMVTIIDNDLFVNVVAFSLILMVYRKFHEFVLTEVGDSVDKMRHWIFCEIILEQYPHFRGRRQRFKKEFSCKLIFSFIKAWSFHLRYMESVYLRSIEGAEFDWKINKHYHRPCNFLRIVQEALKDAGVLV